MCVQVLGRDLTGLLKKLVCVMQDGQVLLARRILVLVRHAADMELARREIQMQSVSVIHSISVLTVNSEKTYVWVNVPITTSANAALVRDKQR